MAKSSFETESSSTTRIYQDYEFNALSVGAYHTSLLYNPTTVTLLKLESLYLVTFEIISFLISRLSHPKPHGDEANKKLEIGELYEKG